MESYEKLLEKAYKEVKVVSGNSERFEIPRAQGQVAGSSTIITNIMNIASYLRRSPAHLAKFMQKELAVPVKLDSNKISFKSKVSSDKVNDKIEKYAKEFVMCPVCGKPDTEIIAEKNIKLKHCLACGAKSPIKYHL